MKSRSPSHGVLELKKTHLVEAVALLMGSLVLGVIFWSLRATDPMWAIISFILVYAPESRAVGATAVSRLLMTVLGSVLAMGAVFAFGIHKWTLPVSVGLIALICGILGRGRTEQRVVLVTVALIIGSSLQDASAGPYIAFTRSIEVTAGSLLAVLFSWGVSRCIRSEDPKAAQPK